MCVEILGRRISDLRGAARLSPVKQERSEIPPDHLSSYASTPQRGHGEELSLPETPFVLILAVPRCLRLPARVHVPAEGARRMPLFQAAMRS